jgi:tetratricopeptide (TPR) repeat protein
MKERDQAPFGPESIDRLNREAWAARAADDREAFGLAEQAFRLAQSANYGTGIRMALRTMAVTALDMGLYAEAFEHATAAAELFRNAGEGSEEAFMQNVLGGVHYYLGDHESRLKCNMRGLELCRRSGDRQGLLRALNNTADTHTRLGEYREAMAMFEECLALSDDSTPYIQCIVLSNMGEVNLLEGRIEAAKELIFRSQDIGKRIGYTEIMVSNLIMLSQIALGRLDANGAIRLLEEAQYLVNERIGLNDQASIHQHLSQAYEELGSHDRALYHHRTFHSLSQQHLDAQKVKEVRSIEFKQEIRTLQHATATLEKLVEERTRQLEQTLAHLQQRDRER